MHKRTERGSRKNFTADENILLRTARNQIEISAKKMHKFIALLGIFTFSAFLASANSCDGNYLCADDTLVFFDALPKLSAEACHVIKQPSGVSVNLYMFGLCSVPPPDGFCSRMSFCGSDS